MISNRESKFIKSLQLKKFRKQENKFIVEGAKNVLELLNSSFVIDKLFFTNTFVEKNSDLIQSANTKYESVKEEELKKVGSFLTNNAALAIVNIPKHPTLDFSKTFLAFDRIKDPGNLGTVIRIADWYGIDSVVCSSDSVDCYNAKVVSATMGSFTRVKVYYENLEDVASQAKAIYAMTLQGDNIHETSFDEPAMLLFGNESTGLSQTLIAKCNQQVKILGFGEAESLNVAISTAVVCDNYRRILSL